MGRNHLLGQEGGRINALLTGCGFNLRKLWRLFKAAASLQPASLFQGRLIRADHRRLPFTIGIDKHASYPEAFAASV